MVWWYGGSRRGYCMVLHFCTEFKEVLKLLLRKFGWFSFAVWRICTLNLLGAGSHPLLNKFWLTGVWLQRQLVWSMVRLRPLAKEYVYQVSSEYLNLYASYRLHGQTVTRISTRLLIVIIYILYILHIYLY